MTRRATGLVGTCGACGGEYRVLRDTRVSGAPTFVAKHGFRRPRDHHVGRCIGAETLPHECWPATAVKHRDVLRAAVATAADELASLERGEFPDVITLAAYDVAAWAREYTRDSLGRRYAEQRVVADARGRLSWLRSNLDEVEHRIADWQLAELRSA